MAKPSGIVIEVGINGFSLKIGDLTCPVFQFPPWSNNRHAGYRCRENGCR